METVEKQREIEALVSNIGQLAPTADDIEAWSARAKAGDVEAAKCVVAAMIRVAAVDPGATMAVLDAITLGTLGREIASIETPADQTAMLANLAKPDQLTAAFWGPFWSFINNRTEGLGGDEVTAMVASLGANVHEGFTALAETASTAHPGAAGAATRALPPKLTLDTLSKLPDGSLGNEFYRLIVDNDFNLEVIDRKDIGYDDTAPALRYLNLRILQMHDVWHLVGGYRTTVLQEVGISAFTLAQFNHNYSAILIATAALSALKNSMDAYGLAAQIISEGWLHGRTTPSFMGIEWENEWHLPISEIRARHGIKPFASIFPADLIEQIQNAA